jgi:hypothetical protein
MENKYVCACGLTCCDCLFYKKEFFEAAKTMKSLIDEYRFDVFYSMLCKSEVSGQIAAHLKQDKTEYQAMFCVFEHMPDFVKVLDGIIAIQCKQTCREKNGCSIGGVTHGCEAIECVTNKGLEGCWKCAEYRTCDKLYFQKNSYGKTVTENLSQLESEGISGLRPRGNQYYEWQRRIIKPSVT